LSKSNQNPVNWDFVSDNGAMSPSRITGVCNAEPDETSKQSCEGKQEMWNDDVF
jgi:hypothetical protein